MKTWLLVLTVALVASFAARRPGTAGEGAAPEKPSPRFKITTRRRDDAVEVRPSQDKVILAVHSPFGISHAILERLDEHWPSAVVLRLHLKGLEHFRIANGKVTLEGSVAIRDGSPQVRLWKDGREDAGLDAKSPFWMDLRIRGADGKPATTIPLKDGYFEMALPRAFLEGDPKALEVSWIDFYRQ
jgi:hypothetical protein